MSHKLKVDLNSLLFGFDNYEKDSIGICCHNLDNSKYNLSNYTKNVLNEDLRIH